MKKIIRVMLLSTVAFCHAAIASELSDSDESSTNEPVMGFVVSSDFTEPVTGVENVQLTELSEMVNEVRLGILPQTLIDMFKDLSKIDIAACGTVMETQRKFAGLRQALNAQLDGNSMFLLNAFLKTIVTPHESQRTAPLADTFWGELSEDMIADNFSDHLFSIYCMLFSASERTLIPQINTPSDWVTVQFLGLFFDSAMSSLSVNVNTVGLFNVDLIREVVLGLHEAATLNLSKINGFPESQQVQILQILAEVRPKNSHIIAAVESVAALESFVTSITHPVLHSFSEGAKIGVSLIVNFQNRELHERITSFTEMFKRVVDRTVPYVWDLMFRLKSLENVSYGDLTPVIRSVVRSPVGANLSLPTLVSDHPMTGYVMTRLKEEFLSPESKVQVLDFEGSQLSNEGLEQLALLAESQKPLHRIRLTGMKIPSAIAGRLGMLRVKGINMVGCGVKAADLTDMVAGWLGEGSILRGVDMCGNEVTEDVASFFVEKGFEVYLQDRRQPYGYMFAK
ncbi:MAG: hypothetical protein I8H80_01380 [Alphaproteobacteria bacterium]|nr:hypothetical protein [Alphaproteobacteria bacterium]